MAFLRKKPHQTADRLEDHVHYLLTVVVPADEAIFRGDIGLPYIFSQYYDNHVSLGNEKQYNKNKIVQ